MIEIHIQVIRIIEIIINNDKIESVVIKIIPYTKIKFMIYLFVYWVWTKITEIELDRPPT